jgi:hypothetical protein
LQCASPAEPASQRIWETALGREKSLAADDEKPTDDPAAR